MKVWLSPIKILIYLLLGLALGATWSWGGLAPETWLTAVRNVALIYTVGFLLYQLFLKISLIKPTRWENRVITSLILFLLFDPSLPWYAFVVLGAASELIQRFVRLPSGPVFNPAASAVLLACILGFLPGWWGVSFSPRIPLFPGGMSIAMLAVVPVAGYVAYKYKKLHIVATAAAVFALLYWLVFNRSPLFILLEGTLAFFLMVMAVEPKTTPVVLREQYAVGGLLAVMIILFQKIHFFDPFSSGLLVTNGAWQLYRWWMRRKLMTQVRGT